ncbi:MAG: hypothetical protein CME71_01765 [Halobacteriovorax sp.]|nr:hypothetical protein [Halobacteriovorax sp.]|tara:strand:- start:818 stop:1711 length:894 start_codon:yes stop_codon:yes gene_type:complete
MSRDFNVDQIKKLWTLDLVLSHGSLKHAALKAKVTPSAISQTITSLEQSFGRPLLIRDKGSVRPTPDAIAILKIVKPAFEAFDKLKDINGEPVPELSWINFGTYESIAINILPGLISSFKLKLPNLRLGLKISRTSNLLTMLRKGELCSALITENDNLDRFYSIDVAEDRLGLYISRSLPATLTTIERLGFGTLEPGRDGLPRYFSKFLKNLKLDKPTILSDSFETLRAATASGSIASVLPQRVASRNEDLVEVTSLKSSKRAVKDLGLHRLVVVGQNNCDREEIKFVASETSRLLN